MVTGRLFLEGAEVSCSLTALADRVYNLLILPKIALTATLAQEVQGCMIAIEIASIFICFRRAVLLKYWLDSPYEKSFVL